MHLATWAKQRLQAHALKPFHDAEEAALGPKVTEQLLIVGLRVQPNELVGLHHASHAEDPQEVL